MNALRGEQSSRGQSQYSSYVQTDPNMEQTEYSLVGDAQENLQSLNELLDRAKSLKSSDDEPKAAPFAIKSVPFKQDIELSISDEEMPPKCTFNMFQVRTLESQEDPNIDKSDVINKDDDQQQQRATTFDDRLTSQRSFSDSNNTIKQDKK